MKVEPLPVESSGRAPGGGGELRLDAERTGANSTQAERFRAVLEIAAAISSARDVDELLRLVMDRLTSLLGVEASTLFMLDESKGELWSRVLRGGGTSLNEIRLSASKGIAGYVVATGQTLVLSDAYADERFNREIDRTSGFRTRSMIAAPLRHVSGKILGVVEVLNRKSGEFTSEDKAVVEAVAAQVAAVLNNVLLLDELRGRNEELTRTSAELSQAVGDLNVLYEIERAVSSSPGQSDLLDRILSKAIEVTGATAGSILLADGEVGGLYFRNAQGARSEALISQPLADGQGIAGTVARTGKAMRVSDATQCESHDASVARALGVSVGAILCVPIAGENRTLGVLELLNKRGGFDENDERIASLLAGQTGRAIDRRDRLERDARKARLASIGQMLSGVLHDLRTPMTIISGYAELMAEEADIDERRRHAAIVEKQFEHINAMTRETLAFARGERELFLRKVYLHSFMKEVEGYLLKDFEHSSVSLKVETGYTGIARFDENKIKRLIYNLARNAAQAMPAGGTFTIQLQRVGEELVFRFKDTGTGIPKEICDRLFESFVSAGKAEGTGLGLAIVKKIAEEHGGNISFETEPGRGTTFEVRLPAGAADDAAEQANA